MRLYLIGSLRNPQIPSIANSLRAEGFQVFDDWFAAGEIADDSWRDYEIARGRSLAEALDGLAAQHVFDFDYRNIITSDAAVLVAPAGRSGHLELGYFLGQGKPGHILLEPETERWDVMYRLATGVHADIESLVAALKDTPRAWSGQTEGDRDRLRAQGRIPPIEIEGERWHYGR